MKYESPIESFKTFSDPIKSILHIKNESDYQDRDDFAVVSDIDSFYSSD